MTRRQGTAQFVARRGAGLSAALGLAALAGCGTLGLFGEYDIPESPEVAAAPYPRLVDVPDAPPAGEYAPGVPDPAQGARTLADLSTEAAVADVLRRDAAGPVVERGGSLQAVVQAAQARAGAIVAAPAPEDGGVAQRAQARARELSRPVISEEERERMLARARQRPGV